MIVMLAILLSFFSLVVHDIVTRYARIYRSTPLMWTLDIGPHRYTDMTTMVYISYTVMDALLKYMLSLM